MAWCKKCKMNNCNKCDELTPIKQRNIEKGEDSHTASTITTHKNKLSNVLKKVNNGSYNGGDYS